MWRTTQDIGPSWSDMLRCLDNNAGLAHYGGPGGWNDPDMLEVSNYPTLFCSSRHITLNLMNIGISGFQT